MDEKISSKIQALFLIVLVFIIIFLARVIYIEIKKPSFFISKKIGHRDLALRGDIISKDNFILAKDEKVYSVAIRPAYLNPKKIDMFFNLLAIYSNTSVKKLKLKYKKYKNYSRIVLLRKIPYNIKKNLIYLSNVLAIHKVFLPDKDTKIIYGLDIYEEKPIRKYPYKDRLEPVLGFIRSKRDKKIGMGLERYYDSVLSPQQNGYIIGLRDVKNRIIYDNNAIIKPRIDGYNLRLNINFVLQGKIENILTKYKKELKAKEIITALMDTKTGKIISIASSNRYNPMHIKNINYTKISHIQYTYEPGSVMKPITLAILLKHKKVNIYEVLNAHNGVFYFKPRFTIYDDERFKFLNIIQAVVHSSNIIFAQLGLRLTPSEFRQGLLNFGFYQKSGIDLPYEYRGVLFSIKGFQSEIHRASNAFGYAMQVNLIQLIKAYNVFNNEGIMITPKIAYQYGNTKIITHSKQVISASIAQTILNILRKVVLKGTAIATNIEGLYIAGKTGTAKISINGKYQKGLYNSSFIGFANDKSHKYTIGVLVVKPDKKRFFASQTAVVVFRKIVETMLDMNLLKAQK